MEFQRYWRAEVCLVLVLVALTALHCWQALITPSFVAPRTLKVTAVNTSSLSFHLVTTGTVTTLSLDLRQQFLKCHHHFPTTACFRGGN